MASKSSMSTDISPQNNAAKNVEGVLDFNALQYECYPDLSVCVDRTFKDSFFQKNEYSAGQTAYCILNSGSDFVNGRTSYLTFDVVAIDEAVQDNDFGWQGSAYNFVKTIRITDRAGNEIEYITDANILANMCRKMKYPEDHLLTVGSSARGRSPAYLNAIPKPSVGVSRYVLYLRDLCGLFDYDQLLPAQLCSGLRIQIVLESASRVAKFAGAFNPLTDDYIITNPRIVLDSHKLTDSVARQLNLRSANDGLEIQYRTWFTSSFNTVANSSISIESRRAVSRAFCALAHVRETPADESVVYSMATDQSKVIEYQWRAGNLYFPQQPVKGLAHQVNTELLQRSHTLYGKTETPLDPSSLTLKDYESFGQPVFADSYPVAYDAEEVRNQVVWDKHGGLAVIPVNLERSSVQDVSGLPLNNSRVLALNATFNDSVSREVKLFLQYLKIARVFMDNTELEE